MSDREEGKTQPAPNGDPAREDDGPHHGSTPPHGDILAHQITNEEREFDADAEEQPLTRG